jgi:hypothetical protein
MAQIHAVKTGVNASFLSADLVFSVNNNSASFAEQARLTSGGNLGIGVSNPVCRLDVVGGPIRKRTAYTVATLPAASLGDGMETYVTDSNATLAAGHGDVVAGGGSNYVPVYSRGGSWLIG